MPSLSKERYSGENACLITMQHVIEKENRIYYAARTFQSHSFLIICFQTNYLPHKNFFLLDCKESLNALLLDRTFKKPYCQSSCPVAGLVKGKFEF